MNLPDDFTLVQVKKDDVLAPGPFVIEAFVAGERIVDLGFDLTQIDLEGVRWYGFDHMHIIVPVAEPTLVGSRISFTTEDGDVFGLRPLSWGDGALVGYEDPAIPANPEETRRAIEYLAEYLYAGYSGTLAEPHAAAEDNLYVTKDAEGEPLALVKMSASHPTLIRQDNVWRALAPDEDELLGNSDMPVREEAVIAWDSGNLQDLERLLMDDRFSPAEVTSVWLEVGDTDELERLLIERSRGRFYERTREGKWVEATPSEDAATVDVIWSAISAWDVGDLRRLSEAEKYDANGEAA